MASRDDSTSSRGAAVVPDPGAELPFRWMVGRVTEALASELDLPTLEEWKASYEKAPERYDAELLGFWKEAK